MVKAHIRRRSRCIGLTFCLRFELQRFVLEILFQPDAAVFPAVAGLFEPAEGGTHIKRAPVDIDLAGAYTSRYPDGSFPSDDQTPPARP